MTDFYTRDAGNQGMKIPLVLPNGEESEDFLVIRSVDSDAFRMAESDAKREVMRAAQVDDIDERRRIAKENTLNMQVALVKEWSFDEPCTPENVRVFLVGAPQVADALDQLATKRALFIEKKSQNSKPTQSTKLNKRKPRKGQASAKAST